MEPTSMSPRWTQIISSVLASLYAAGCLQYLESCHQHASEVALVKTDITEFFHYAELVSRSSVWGTRYRSSSSTGYMETEIPEDPHRDNFPLDRYNIGPSDPVTLPDSSILSSYRTRTSVSSDQQQPNRDGLFPRMSVGSSLWPVTNFHLALLLAPMYIVRMSFWLFVPLTGLLSYLCKYIVEFPLILQCSYEHCSWLPDI